MSAGNSGQQYNVEMYQDNIAEDDQDVYMDGEDYGEEYEENYVQLSDGSIVPAPIEENEDIDYSMDDYQEQSQSHHLSEVNHQSVSLYPAQKPQVFRLDRSTANARQGAVYKYVKASTPILREDKQLQRPRISLAHQQPQQAVYHVVQQQPSVSYAYESQSSSTTPNSSYNQSYAYATQKPLEVKPPPKQNKRKTLAGQRKPCNCTKSMCLKLYCDCFANGEFCKDCNCKDCRNNLEFEADRTRAIKQSLERNPNAFKPKIGVSKAGATQQDVERLHQKGCHCKKSGCLKNYCECYEAKVPCTDRCKCKGCQNTEADRTARYKDKLPGSSLLGSLSGAGQTAAPPKVRNESDSDTDNEPESTDPRGYPWFYMTDEVIDAATMCMVAQAEEALTQPVKTDTEELERLVLREFGRCLQQIIKSTTARDGTNASKPPTV